MYSTCEDPIKFANFGFGITLYYVLFKEVFKILIILLVIIYYNIYLDSVYIWYNCNGDVRV